MREVTGQQFEAADNRLFLVSGTGAKVKTLVSDYFNFINLILFFVLVWPVALLCFGLDRTFKTRLLDAVIRFCEAF